MEMTGEQRISAPQAEVWRGLNDPEVLKQCITGCETIEKTGENEYKVAMTAAVGPVKAKFAGKMAISDIVAPTSYAIAFEGSGGAAGFAKGSATVKLEADGAGTKMTYTAKANVGGKLAQIGSRLIDGVAKKQADDFFAKFNAVIAPKAAEVPATAAAPAAASAGAAPVEATGAAPFNPLWLVGGIIAAMVVIHALMGPAKYIS
jgi:carbon monoxide dehydrogenase subunit G